MIMNMIESSEVVKIFLDYEISNIKEGTEIFFTRTIFLTSKSFS